MKSFLKSFLASLLAIVVVVGLVFIIFIGIASTKLAGDKVEVEDGTYLVIDIYGEMLEYSPPVNIMTEITGGEAETLQRILSNLRKAEVDDRIRGVIMKVSASNGAGRAKMEEIRKAIARVREAGKKVYGYSDSMDRNAYYLISACDSIFMPGTGYIRFTGFSVTSMHVKNMLEKLDINPQIHRIKDYKSAAEMIIREDMSEESKKNKEWMLDEYWDIFAEAVAMDRGISEQELTGIMKMATFQVEDARKAGLVDSVMYWDEIEKMLKGGEDELRTISQGRYAKISPRTLGLKGDRKIAVVHAQGTIGGRKSRIDPLMGVMMGHESVISQIRKAREDDRVAALVFRVDSPGGEALASDLIGHEIEITTAVKPVVVSMVDVAASGGYHISYRADRIVADRTTLTGSIGSISGKMNVAGFERMLGITHDFVSRGPNALMYSPYKDFTEKQWEIFREEHWAGFNDWLRDVSEHRGIPFEEAEKLAHGRVWTGRQGVKNGLVDETGDLHRAVEIAAELAGMEEDEEVTLVHYPVRRTLFEKIMSGGSFTATAKYAVYHFIRNDIAETWDMLTNKDMYMINRSVLD
jgi:protease-4